MEFSVRTSNNQEFIDITGLVRKAVDESRVKDGLAVVFIPHTTAGVTINENADPDVVKDFLSALNEHILYTVIISI
jgi:secondary thiamine-phosphate synthase enzyme